MKKIYDFPYHALVEIKFAHNQGTMHIPLPFFSENQNRIDFVLDLAISEKIRDNEFFHCPICKTSSFYAGVCEECYETLYAEFYEDENEDSVEFYKYREEFYKEKCKFIRIQHNHEALKSATKKEFLRRLDDGIPSLGIISACIIFADRDVNDHWYLPYLIDTKLSEINSDVYKIIDKWIDEGKIEPFIRLDSERKLLHIPHKDFGDPIQDFIYELEEELGFRIEINNLPFIFGDKNDYETCHRCGKITREVKMINGNYLCKDCCKDDPVVTIEAAIGINYDLTGYIYSDYLDPETLEELTNYTEVPKEVFDPMFKGYVKRIIIYDTNLEEERYFVYQPNLMPEYKHIFENNIDEYELYEDESNAEIIQVEGSEELRRQVNGVWQHKHEGYDYWHPMARVHKPM